MERVMVFLQKLQPWILTSICFVAICWLTLASDPLGDTELPLFPGADKIAHALMFGGFAFCIIIDWNRRRGWPLTFQKADIYSADIASAFGLVIELLQKHLHNGRSGDVWDLVADITGAFIVSAAVCCYKLYLRKKYNL